MAALAIGIAAVAGAALWAGLLGTVSPVAVRLWPAGDRRWLLALNWGLVLVFDASTAVVAALTWNTWLIPRTPAPLGAGLALVTVGTALALAGGASLDPAVTAGRDGPLVTEGLYTRTRHPQYLGIAVALAGVVVVANSAAVTALLAANAGWLGLRAVAEERHLRRRHGAAYERYRTRVPRFLGVGTLRP